MVTLDVGETIVGKWNGNKYTIIKKLGHGGTGHVYLVEDAKNRKKYAMKISDDSISLNREYNLLRRFSYINIVVRVYEQDDIYIGSEQLNFILLEYIQGKTLKELTYRKVDINIALGIIIIILEGLKKFHGEGYILGDLKLENIMVDRGHHNLRIIDLGGVVEEGGTIKEFTPAYDRASWKCGERRSEGSYDIFTVNMVLIRLLLDQEIDPRKNDINYIMNKIRLMGINEKVQVYILNILRGKSYSVENLKKGFIKIYKEEERNKAKIRNDKRDRRINFMLAVSCISFVLVTVFIYYNL